MPLSHTTGFVFCLMALVAFGAQTPSGWGVAPTAEQQAESLRAAIADLTADFGPRYPDGGTYLKELDTLKPRLSEGDSDSRAAAAKAFEALQRKALIANPLVGGTPILFVGRHQYAPDHHNTGTDFQPGPYIYLLGHHRPGAALKVIDVARNGESRTLAETKEGCIRDPDVSFDGSRIVFAMRRDANEAFQIYEIRADGSGLKRLTQSTPVKAGHHDVKLTEEDLARIITWIDINAPYYGSYHTAYGDNLFGRVPLTFQQLDELSALTDLPYRRDAKTGRGVIREDRLHHDPAIRNTELTGSQVDFTRPENSVCLTRLDPGDPRYARALAIIREGQANLRRQPREDMIGPEPEPVLASDVFHSQHNLRQQACESKSRMEARKNGRSGD